jgi:hypothetical protein
MSEFINNSTRRQETLKQMIRQLHEGQTVDQVKPQTEAQWGAPEAKAAPQAGPGLIPLQVGALSAQQMALMLTHLPVDVTFVDENDEVRFFSTNGHRPFERTPAVIGCKVQQCHPPQSVHRVQRILDDFRAGRRDEAQFWIQTGSATDGRFFHIRYSALRDAEGCYLGTVEVTQDVSDIRALKGERRLIEEGE